LKLEGARGEREPTRYGERSFLPESRSKERKPHPRRKRIFVDYGPNNTG